MLKIIKVPDETTFTEADLKPGLRVIRKSDGAECVVHKHDKYWAIYRGFSVVMGDHSATLLTPTNAITWLNRDFRRVESPPQYKMVGEVPAKVVFDYECSNFVFATNYTAHGFRRCVCLDGGESLSIQVDTPVTRVHGPLTIDPSVKEGV